MADSYNPSNGNASNNAGSSPTTSQRDAIAKQAQAEYEKSKQITNAKLTRSPGARGKPHPPIQSLPPKRIK